VRIAVGSDHAGFPMKEQLAAHLREAGHEVVDCGTHSTDRVDYPDFGAAVGRMVRDGGADGGLCVCAATVHDVTSAHLAREHNDANVICLGQRLIGPEVAREALDAWLGATFEGGRHAGRVEKLDSLGGEPA